MATVAEKVKYVNSSFKARLDQLAMSAVRFVITLVVAIFSVEPFIWALRELTGGNLSTLHARLLTAPIVCTGVCVFVLVRRLLAR